MPESARSRHRQPSGCRSWQVPARWLLSGASGAGVVVVERVRRRTADRTGPARQAQAPARDDLELDVVELGEGGEPAIAGRSDELDLHARRIADRLDGERPEHRPVVDQDRSPACRMALLGCRRTPPIAMASAPAAHRSFTSSWMSRSRMTPPADAFVVAGASSRTIRRPGPVTGVICPAASSGGHGLQRPGRTSADWVARSCSARSAIAASTDSCCSARSMSSSRADRVFSARGSFPRSLLAETPKSTPTITRRPPPRRSTVPWMSGGTRCDSAGRLGLAAGGRAYPGSR